MRPNYIHSTSLEVFPYSVCVPTPRPQAVFIFYLCGRTNGLVFIARVMVRMRYSITQILGNRIFQ